MGTPSYLIGLLLHFFPLLENTTTTSSPSHELSNVNAAFTTPLLPATSVRCPRS